MSADAHIAPLHVVFCGKKYNDHRTLRHTERSGATTDWPVPSKARAGDRLAFYNADHEKAFVAKGIVETDAKHVGPRDFRSQVGSIRMLTVPVPRDAAIQLLPEWKGLRNTRNASTVHPLFSNQVWALLCKSSKADNIETGARADAMFGEKLYQKRARLALPLLVVLAEQGAKIYYQDLAKQLGISNPRVLNYVLGSVGQTLIELGQRWGKTIIPPIQCIVINKVTKLPGEGIGFFMDKVRYAELTLAEKRVVVCDIHQAIWAYPKWREVLGALSLKPVSPEFSSDAKDAPLGKGAGFGTSENNKLVEKAAVEFVTRHLQNKNYTVESREQERIGYDLDAKQVSKETLHIEVKGIAGAEVQFPITAGEMRRAKNDPAFHLYVVTNATSSQSKLHLFTGAEVQARFELVPLSFMASIKKHKGRI